MPFDVWLAESCSTINNLTETSHLSKLNCASKSGGSEKTYVSSAELEESKKAQLELFFELEQKSQSVCERERERGPAANTHIIH